MNYTKITTSIIGELKEIVGDTYVFLDEENLSRFVHNKTEQLCVKPELVISLSNAQEISAILFLANKHLIPITPRAAGTGLSGGALPLMGGIVLSVERLNKIIEIDERNLQATVECGVINEVFQNAVKEKGLFYPPDPSSKGSCFMGGNIAHGSGGPKWVK